MPSTFYDDGYIDYKTGQTFNPPSEQFPNSKVFYMEYSEGWHDAGEEYATVAYPQD